MIDQVRLHHDNNLVQHRHGVLVNRCLGTVYWRYTLACHRTCGKKAWSKTLITGKPTQRGVISDLLQASSNK